MAAYYDNGDALLIFPNLKGKCYGLRLLLTDSGHYLIAAYDFQSQDSVQRQQIEQTNLHAQAEHRSLSVHLASMRQESSGSSFFLVGNVFNTGVSIGPHLDTTKGGTQPESFAKSQKKAKQNFPTTMPP